jgi:hypothetical protein
MPPKGKLPQSQLDDLIAWVKRGAAAPADTPAAGTPQPEKDFDLASRLKHWSYQPVTTVQPPAVTDASWPRTPIDAFILARLESAGLRPAPPADQRTLMRRVSYDLIGLPPTPAELEAFLADTSPDAYERAVERLLASPHYGERWGRHWLDLVRYAETLGHEFDYELFNAWRYRDYVVRALNADLPYDQFVIEHVAGDLLPQPRRHPTAGWNESILGTGFFWLGEGKHSPVDIRQEQTDKIDNQIDVLSKTFLAQTIACARCHDHKFDAIPTRDYYALAGYLKSTRYQQAAIDPHDWIADKVEQLVQLKLQAAAALKPVEASVQPVTATTPPGKSLLFDDFSRPGFEDWFVTGEAFTRPTRHGDFLIEPGNSEYPAIQGVAAGLAHSGLLSRRLEGALRSESFTLEHRYLQVLAAGKGSRINLVIDGFNLIRDPIYGSLTIRIDGEKPAWRTVDLQMWQGHRAYLEIIDSTTPDLTQGTSAEAASGRPGDGYIAVDEIRLSDDRSPPPMAQLNEGFRPGPRTGQAERLTELVDEYRRIEQDLPAPLRAPAAADGPGEDERVLLRGNYRTPGNIAPRGLPAAVCGTSQPAPQQGSGRLDFARRLVDPNGPLVARVMVNRIWQHHFGEGIVRSPDDFGRMGQPPTHPELLDWLAHEFVRSGWSIKQMHRQMVLSSSYRMSSRLDARAEAVDPQNRLLHRMPIRRLEAEAIRDAILAVSGRLDRTLFGPSVMPYLTEFMEGRGRPRASGPLDGAGRRSIYISVRRNFLTPMFLAFDYPIPFNTIGRRSTSNVPAQALSLMNGPLVVEQSRRWADSVLAAQGRTAEEHITAMYLAAFSRPPTEEELRDSLGFVRQQSRVYGTQLIDPRAWADLAHVLMNVKEFIYVE